MDLNQATSWSTIALAILTAIYAFLTWRLSASSAEAARASRDAASESSIAAHAAARQADAMVAQIPVDFTCVRILATSDRAVALVRSESATVQVKSVAVQLLAFLKDDGRMVELQRFVTTYPDAPLIVHAGDEALAAIDAELKPGTPAIGSIEVEYRLGPDSEWRMRQFAVSREVEGLLERSPTPVASEGK